MCVCVCVRVRFILIPGGRGAAMLYYQFRKSRSCKRGCPYVFFHRSCSGPTSCCATIPTSLPLVSCVNIRVVDPAAMFVQKTKERDDTLFLQMPCVAAGRFVYSCYLMSFSRLTSSPLDQSFPVEQPQPCRGKGGD